MRGEMQQGDAMRDARARARADDAVGCTTAGTGMDVASGTLEGGRMDTSGG